MSTYAKRQNVRVVSFIAIQGNVLKVDLVNITLPEGSHVEPAGKPLWIRFDDVPQLKIRYGRVPGVSS
jgi:hypothetical protein